jgi:hypothetical protein
VTVVANRRTGLVYAGVVSSGPSVKLAVIDPQRGQVSTSVPLPGEEISALAVDESTNTVFASVMIRPASGGDGLAKGALLAVDPTRGVVTGTIALTRFNTSPPRYLAAGPADGRVYAYSGGDVVEVVDTSGQTVAGVIPLPDHGSASPTGGGLLMDRQKRRLWAVGSSAGGGTIVSEIDLATRAVKSTKYVGTPISVGAGFDRVAADEAPFVVVRKPEGIFVAGHEWLTLPVGFTPNQAVADLETDASPNHVYISSHTREGSYLFRAELVAGEPSAVLTPTPVTLGLQEQVAFDVLVLRSPPGSACRVILVDFRKTSLWRWTDGCPPS